MASPFYLFRKNQGVVMAALAVILVITWVIVPSLFQDNAAQGRRNTDPAFTSTVVSWNGGKISAGDLQEMRFEHESVQRFLAAIYSDAVKEGKGAPRADGLDPRQGRFGISTSSTDPALVETVILAEAAKKQGIVVDDNAVNAFLINLGGTNFEAPQILDIAKAVCNSGSQSSGMNPTRIYRRLKLELQAECYRKTRFAGMRTVPPSDMWRFHEKLHRRLKIEAYPVAASAEMANVAEPTSADEAALKALYEQGKNRLPLPYTFEPGFKTPHQIAFGYFKIDGEAFLEAEKKKITAEEIAKEYEASIARGEFKQKLDLLAVPLKDDKAAVEGQEPKVDAPTHKPAETPATEKPAEPAAPTEPPAEKTAPPAEEKPTEKPAEKAAEPAAPAEPKTSAVPVGPNRGAQFVSLLVDDAPAATTEAKPAEGAAEAKPAETKPAADAPAATTEAKPAETKPADVKPTEGKPAEGKPEAEVKFKPLEEVSDAIRTRLSLAKAETLRSAAAEAAKKEFRAYAKKRKKALAVIAKKESSESQKAEAKAQLDSFDGKKIAAAAGVEFGQTTLLDQFSVEETELGKEAYKAVQMPGQFGMPGRFSRVEFGQYAFVTGPSLFEMDEADSFVFWRTEEVKEAVTPYEQAKPQVIAAWKQAKAFEQAKTTAEKLAAGLSKEKSLKETVPDAKLVIEPLPFSWYTESPQFSFEQSNGPQMVELKEIKNAGNEFRKSVFALEPGQIGTANDDNHQTVYVVRVVEDEPALAVRRQQFVTSLQGRGRQDLLILAQQEYYQYLIESNEQLEKEYDVKWKRDKNFNPRSEE